VTIFINDFFDLIILPCRSITLLESEGGGFLQLPMFVYAIFIA